MATCTVCGEKLGLIERAKYQGLCRRHHEEQRANLEAESRAREAAKASSRKRYQELLSGLTSEGADPGALASSLDEAAAKAELSAAERRSLGREVFYEYAERTLADDLLTQDEEDRFNALAEAVGIDNDALTTTERDLFYRIVVARANDGRLPPAITSPQMMVKKSEVVHAETEAQILKEVALREYQGGYSGVSFRVMKGVRFHTGGMRGRSVVVGTKMQVADTGVFAITSQRAVFMGAKSTVEMPYSKLINLNVFTDGIQFHLTGRKTAPLFRLPSGALAAAIINGCIQRYT